MWIKTVSNVKVNINSVYYEFEGVDRVKQVCVWCLCRWMNINTRVCACEYVCEWVSVCVCECECECVCVCACIYINVLSYGHICKIIQIIIVM